MASRVVRATLQRLGRHIDSLKPSTPKSRWIDYQTQREHYSEEDLRGKADFVRHFLNDPGIHTVLDLGCNTGEYSWLAAELGKQVVAVDADDASVQRLYEQGRGNSMDVMPAVINIARPSPAMGWMNAEVPSFIDRALHRFDCVMALGLMHHLIVTERVPLVEIVDLLCGLTASLLIVEWIDRQDRRFRELAGPNWPLYDWVVPGRLEEALGQRFVLVAKRNLRCETRVLYCWRLSA